MSAASTNLTSIPGPPPGTVWRAAVGPALNFIMIAATMGSALIAMLLALFFFSTPSLRRKPVFILNVAGLILGIWYAIAQVYEEFRTLLFPNDPVDPHFILVMGAWVVIVPALIDCILLLRISVVYPYSRTSPATFYFVMGVPILTMIARLINAAIFLDRFVKTINTKTAAGEALQALAFHLPSIKIEWVLQVFDDIFSSAIFLSRVYTQTMFSHGRTMSQTIRALFWISASNFVFPVILGIAQLATYLANPDSLTPLYIEAVNFHFTIMGVVFATLWVAEGEWAGTRNFGSKESVSASSEVSTIILNTRRQRRRMNTEISILGISTETEVYPQSLSDSAAKQLQSEYEMADRNGNVNGM
ncbi:hypothetical protein C8F04DRAFT_1276553 [Mycena alexandri]|uniref:Uncharacterized protein n=1 Tax=Mycena alexandri TaxID=1745969 RepID=A0AAD6S1P1_9AGAR|nr:hypothetical protein C8F04DRAFT_1276553 [Mycena alexandri]